MEKPKIKSEEKKKIVKTKTKTKKRIDKIQY
jgi:hypothetical protein